MYSVHVLQWKAKLFYQVFVYLKKEMKEMPGAHSVHGFCINSRL